MRDLYKRLCSFFRDIACSDIHTKYCEGHSIFVQIIKNACGGWKLKNKKCWWGKSYDVLDYGIVFMTIKHILLLKSDYYKVKKTHSHYCKVLPLCIKLIFRKTMLQWKRLQSFYFMHIISFFL